jgi:ADP-heptose:LPS heptosyltransferase
VLIVRLDAVGDALALVPLLAALRDRAARIDIVLTPRNAGIFSKSAVDRVYVATFPQRDESASVRRQIDDLGKQVAEHPYDYALIATEDPAGYRLARASGARNRIGFDNGWGKPVKTLWARSQCTRTVHRTAGLDPRAPHESEVLFALGSGIVTASAPPRDPRLLRRFVIDEEPAPDPRLVMQVTSKWERLGAPASDVVELARELQKSHTVRFIAAESERAYGHAFAEQTNAAVEYFAELRPWKEAIAGAKALVAPDSGAVHVAGMTGTPAVAVFSPANFNVQTARWSPWAAPYRVVKLENGWPASAAAALNELLSGTPATGTT